MGNVYKNKGAQIATTDPTVVYTCPASTTTLVKSLYVVNTDSSTRTITVEWTDDSAGETYTLVKNASISAHANAQVLGDQPIVLEQNDSIRVTASDASVFDCTVSVMQMT